MITIPRKDFDFNVVQTVIVLEATRNAETWNLDADWMAHQLLPEAKKWDVAWRNYQPIATRTRVITFTKGEARKSYEKLLRKLVKNLQSNVRVSEDDLSRMGIVIPNRQRTSAPVPSTYPVFSVNSGMIRRLSIHYRDKGKTSNAKPQGVHGAEIKWGIGAMPPSAPDALPYSSFDTHTPITLDFEEFDRGKPLYFCMRWQNTTGAKGPWSEIGMAIIP